MSKRQQPQQARPDPVKVRMRLAPGIHAVSAAEVEIRDTDGARLAGGNGAVEFNLWTETWVDVVIIRP